MKHRKLGITGIEVSEIGFGTWGLGGDSYGAVDDNLSRKILRLAFERGVTFYDTSDLYGDGHSESILGDVFSDCRDKVVIATKVGTLPHRGFYMPQDFSKKKLLEGIEASLKRLKTDYVDLYQLHSPQIDIPNWDEVVETLNLIKLSGKIRSFGISARSPSDAIIAINSFGFDVIQINFNMIDHRAIDLGLLDLCTEKNIGVIARTPLCFGFLSGKLTGEEDFGENDHRSNWPREQLRRWAKAPVAFSPLNLGKKRSMVQLALQFCLSVSAVSTVIPGMMTAEEVVENTDSIDFPEMTRDEVERIRSIYHSEIYYDPKAKQV